MITKELTKSDIGRGVVYNNELDGIIKNVFPKIRVAKILFKNDTVGFCDVADLTFNYVKA